MGRSERMFRKPPPLKVIAVVLTAAIALLIIGALVGSKVLLWIGIVLTAQQSLAFAINWSRGAPLDSALLTDWIRRRRER